MRRRPPRATPYPTLFPYTTLFRSPPGPRVSSRPPRGAPRPWTASPGEIGRAHVWTPVTFRNLVCRLLLEKKKNHIIKLKCVAKFVYLTSFASLYIPYFFFFFFNDTATTEIYTLSYTLSLHDALPIYSSHIQKSRMPSSACDWS